jgi:hypothetical protein
MAASVNVLWDCAITDRTRTQYSTGVNTYFRFLQLSGADFKSADMPPVTEQLLIGFCAFCSEKLQLRFSTIKLYLSGIRFYYLRNWGFSPLEGANGQGLQCLHTILTGIKKKQMDNVRTLRLPITADILRRMCLLLTAGTFTVFTDSLIQAACVVAFFGFLRCGEFTCYAAFDPSVNLCISDVLVLEDRLELTLTKSKTDPFRHGVTIFIYKNNTCICPVTAMERYLSLRALLPNSSTSSSLFIDADAKPMTRSFFVRHVKSLLFQVGLNPDLYNGHSFRVGSATSSHKARLEDHLIKSLGRWSSDCYTRYIRTSPAILKQAQFQICQTAFL